jgi:hypothetical protein
MMKVTKTHAAAAAAAVVVVVVVDDELTLWLIINNNVVVVIVTPIIISDLQLYIVVDKRNQNSWFACHKTTVVIYLIL